MFKHPSLVTDDDFFVSRPVLDCGETMTKKSMKDECDINRIMDKYQRTGMVSFVNNAKGEYMEIDPIDFQTAMDMIVQGKEMFSGMPSSMRKKFNNDPQQFLEFVHDPENLEQMYDMGLAERPQAPEPDPVVVDPDAPPAP